MDQPAPSNCAACGKTQDAVRKLITVGGPTLCDGCIHEYGAALKQAFDEDSRARAGSSMLIAAEEMALDLIDALETSRAEQAERAELEEIEARTRKLRLVEPESALYPVKEAAEEEEPESEEDEFPSEEDEFPSEADEAKRAAEAAGGAAEASPGGEAASEAEPSRGPVRHCPWCTGNLELRASEGQPARYQCVSCGRSFDISVA